MPVEHQIARLTARGPQITGEGFGGTAELSQTDIAAALAGLDGPIYWYMRLKFVGDGTVESVLRDALAYKILGRAMMEGHDLSARAAPGLAIVAIRQATQGGICANCNGTKIILTQDSAADCKPCRGTGRLNMTQDRAAALAGVSTPTYTKRYEKIVNYLVAMLDQYESIGLSHVSRKLYGRGKEE